MIDISVQELKERLDSGEELNIIDVREPSEVAVSKIEGSINIPMSELVNRLDELEKFREKELILQCRSGGRSGQVTNFLRKQGFENPRNLVGGMQAWARNFYPNLPVA